MCAKKKKSKSSQDAQKSLFSFGDVKKKESSEKPKRTSKPVKKRQSKKNANNSGKKTLDDQKKKNYNQKPAVKATPHGKHRSKPYSRKQSQETKPTIEKINKKIAKPKPLSVDSIIATYDFVVEEEYDISPVGFVPPSAPDTFKHYMLLNVEYDRDTNKALMRLYDPETKKIYQLLDPINHEPYCLHRLPKDVLENNRRLTSLDGFKRIEKVTKIDLLDAKEKEFSKLVGTTPIDIASGRSSIKNVLPDVLEANIRYHLNYISDLQLVPGLYYSFNGQELKMDDISLDDNTRNEINELMAEEPAEYKNFFTEYFELFVPTIPDFPRVAFDLEIYQESEDKFPDPSVAREPIISASIVSNDGLNEVLVWKGHKFFDLGEIHEGMEKELKVRVFESEAQLIRELFRIIWRYPITLTFNGDEFDLLYLNNRIKRKNINISREENPIVMTRGIGVSNHSAFLKYGLHVDLYQFFRNRSIQGYGFGGSYTENSLDAISQALLGAEKFKFDGGISELSFMDLVYYNWRDSQLTLELSRFRENLSMSLIILLMRICRLPMNEVVRTWVSAWVKQLLIWEHRKRNYVVPNQSEIAKGTHTENGLKGAIVIDPEPGIYFDVVVMDFSSLYPSIIKEYNLSYETIECRCDDCKKSPIPNTPYHKCDDRIGIMSLVTGVIRDLRVLYFKPRSKKNPFYNTLQSALKVLINASYGVYGSENFSLYCFAVADSTTAIGRYSITKTVSKAEELGVKVLYGDSDSVFLKDIGEEKAKKLREWSEEELKLELDVEKSYRFLALSDRKKNYLGVYKSGGVDIKGLVGKKSNTPKFIRDAFFKFTEVIENIKNKEDFIQKRNQITNFIKQYWMKIKRNELPVEDYEVKVTLRSSIVKRILAKEEPEHKIQHVMAARDLHKLKGTNFEPGSVFSYVKVKSGAKALELANRDEIDRKKYRELFRSTFEQVLDALGISFDEVIGIKKLDSFF